MTILLGFLKIKIKPLYLNTLDLNTLDLFVWSGVIWIFTVVGVYINTMKTTFLKFWFLTFLQITSL